MDAREVELLVHITAPSRASDDVRYLAIASSVQDFQPAIRTRISGPDEDVKAARVVEMGSISVNTRLVPVGL
jgi:hypothetical protein